MSTAKRRSLPAASPFPPRLSSGRRPTTQQARPKEATAEETRVALGHAAGQRPPRRFAARTAAADTPTTPSSTAKQTKTVLRARPPTAFSATHKTAGSALAAENSATDAAKTAEGYATANFATAAATPHKTDRLRRTEGRPSPSTRSPAHAKLTANGEKGLRRYPRRSTGLPRRARAAAGAQDPTAPQSRRPSVRSSPPVWSAPRFPPACPPRWQPLPHRTK